MSFDVSAARRRCLAYRRRILDISQRVPALHAAGAFSCLEIVDTIYGGLMRREIGGTPRFADSFVMSKGHGVMAQYVVLEALGILSPHDLDLYCTPRGQLGCHPDHGVPGIEASTGSLGHGLGMATGMAYADRIQGEDRDVYVLLSDGELQEGSTWEALQMAANLQVANLVAFVDLNDMASFSRMSETHPAFYPVLDKLRAFGWEAAEANGHDAGAVHAAVTGRQGGRPFVLVGRTVKGRGVAFMEGVPIWHYRSPNQDEYARAVAELTEVAS